MTKFSLRAIFAVLGIITASLSFSILLIAQEEHGEDSPPHWTYEGEEGPENWGELSEDFALCGAGQAQSPIDIAEVSELNLSDISFSYGETALNIFNNGHTIQVNVDGGSSISYNGITYDLLQFHFHHPSEHTVDGVAATMEIHFVHRDPNSGNLAVVGVLLMEGEESNAAYSTIFDYLPAEQGEADSMGMSLELTSLLPETGLFNTYNGSLTTPPCSEIVRWLVLQEAIYLSSEQVEAFAAIFEMNARPTQPLNRRDLLGDNG